MTAVTIRVLVFLVLGLTLAIKGAAAPAPSEPKAKPKEGAQIEPTAELPPISVSATQRYEWKGSIGAFERDISVALRRQRDERARRPASLAAVSSSRSTTASKPAPAVPTDTDRPLTLWFGPPSPNPTSGGVSFQLNLPVRGRLQLVVMDVAGRIVNEVEETREVGRNVVYWNGRDRSGATRPAGVYFARLFVNGVSAGARRVVFLR